MEYCEHELKSILEDRKLAFNPSETKRLVYMLLEAVKFMHEACVMHRDLKTSNLLYTCEG